MRWRFGNFSLNLLSKALTASRLLFLPDKDGTLAVDSARSIAFENLIGPGLVQLSSVSGSAPSIATETSIGASLRTAINAESAKSIIGLPSVSDLTIGQVRSTSLKIGTNAGTSSTTGNFWTAIGNGAGRYNTSGDNWTAIGVNAGLNNSSGAWWLAIGVNAGLSNTTGGFWTALGVSAGQSNTTGQNWLAIGVNAGLRNTTGSSWVAIGVNSGLNNTTGLNWVAIGDQAGYDITTGSSNTTIGYNCGRGLVTGNGNTVIGANITGLPAAMSNTVVIGSGDGDIKLLSDQSGLKVGSSNASSRFKLISPNGTLFTFGVSDSGTIVAIV